MSDLLTVASVTPEEHPASALLGTAIGPLGHMAVAARNDRAPRRLMRLAEAPSR